MSQGCMDASMLVNVYDYEGLNAQKCAKAKMLLKNVYEGINAFQNVHEGLNAQKCG